MAVHLAGSKRRTLQAGASEASNRGSKLQGSMAAQDILVGPLRGRLCPGSLKSRCNVARRRRRRSSRGQQGVAGAQGGCKGRRPLRVVAALLVGRRQQLLHGRHVLLQQPTSTGTWSALAQLYKQYYLRLDANHQSR